MLRLLIISEVKNGLDKLCSELTQKGFACSKATIKDEVVTRVTEQSPDLIMVEMNGHAGGAGVMELTRQLKREAQQPVMALVSRERLDSPATDLSGIDDFVVIPCEVNELVLRAKRILQRVKGTDTSEVIRCGDLTIDKINHEVNLRGAPVELAFKEYELLLFLASNRGRVFTREALLNKVWGYDYYGGDRTVDVHIRRLRSKIEDSEHIFIDTVRNIGYRFRKDL